MPYSLNRLNVDDALQTLEIARDDLSNKPEAAIVKLIRKKYKLLALKHHPDRPGGNNSRFQSVKKAYDALIIETDEHADELARYFESAHVDISLKAFNFVMEEEIERINSELRREFSELANEKAKESFAKQHADFFNLAQTLENNKEKILRIRIEALSQQELDHSMKQAYTNGIIEWRKHIITLFGEEGLDDFQYREALASGNLWPILDTAKLMLPTKWLAAIISSVALCLSHTMDALPYLMFGHQLPEQMLMLYYLVSAIFLATFLPTPVALLVLGAPTITKALLMLACPYNLIIRPLQERFSEQPKHLISAGIALLALLASTSVFFIITTTPPAILIALVQIALQFWIIYQNYALIMAEKELTGEYNPVLIKLLVISTIGSLLNVATATSSLFSSVHALMCHLPEPTSALLWQDQAFDLIMNCNMSQIISRLQFHKDFVANIMEQLPLPEKPVTDQVKNAYTSENTRATQSHYFFKTPKDACPKHAKIREPLTPEAEHCLEFS
ncbi:MAG: J domain-containing protein [Legionellaceae bacterium]|nr:J domain-containing protein [Legionellaceae bacterium]